MVLPPASSPAYARARASSALAPTAASLVGPAGRFQNAFSEP